MRTTTYDLRISLKHFEPVVWRRVLVYGDTRLDMLHEIIQAAMGWEDLHLHSFNSDGKTYMLAALAPEFEFTYDEGAITLEELAPRKGAHFEYRYDFSDGWQHHIVVEEILPSSPEMNVPSVVAGENACPLEDSGGVDGYKALLNAWHDSHHSDHDEIVDMVGKDFNPERFDLLAANARLRELE